MGRRGQPITDPEVVKRIRFDAVKIACGEYAGCYGVCRYIGSLAHFRRGKDGSREQGRPVESNRRNACRHLLQVYVADRIVHIAREHLVLFGDDRELDAVLASDHFAKYVLWRGQQLPDDKMLRLAFCNTCLVIPENVYVETYCKCGVASDERSGE